MRDGEMDSCVVLYSLHELHPKAGICAGADARRHQ